jgi:hypothetical protein
VTVPPRAVVDAINSGAGIITRRIEFYESDGITQWYPDADDTETKRLVEGSVSVDGTRQERRTVDLTLRNDDNLLRPNPNDGFWYDKVIKCYRGIKYPVHLNTPDITVVDAVGTFGAQRMQSTLKQLGYTRTFADTVSASYDTDVMIAFTETAPTSRSDLLVDQYNSGRGVITISNANTGTQVPMIGAGSALGATTTWGVTPVTHDTPLAGSWSSGTAPGTFAGYGVSGLVGGAVSVAGWSSGGGPTTITASLVSRSNGGRWVNLQLPSVDDAGIKQLLSAAIQWAQDYSPEATWETQIGEFCIDALNDQNFPYQIKVTGRDYMKRMINSKLSQDETYVSGTNVTDLIRALARNSGITNKINVPNLGRTLLTDLAYPRKTPRADIAVGAANGIGYDLYFNPFGELTMSPLPDPTLDAVQNTFLTGADGNLVSVDRSTNDSNLFNHIAIYGNPNDAGIPYFGEALNVDPNSNTRIARIGDRYDDMQFDTVESDAECATLALKFLKVSSLETYELSFNAICYPWIEANTIAKIVDPKAFSFEPTKYLMDTLNIPMSLGPMDATGKRITIVSG